MTKVFKKKSDAVKYRKQMYKQGKPTYTYQMADGSWKIYAYKKTKTTTKPKKIKSKPIQPKIQKIKPIKKTPIRQINNKPRKTEFTKDQMSVFYDKYRQEAFPKKYSQSDNTVDLVVNNFEDIFERVFKRPMKEREYAELEDGVWNGVF